MEEFDVAVVGGGAAGIAAAVGAARSGARVCLIERYGFLGGAATASSVLTHCGFFDQNGEQVVRGVGQSVLDRLAAQDLYRTHTVAATGNKVVLLDLETMKRVYDEIVLEAGVSLYLHSFLVSAEAPDGSVESVTLAHRGGVRTITATSFVDASGDGVLIKAAEAEELLSPPRERQASTLVMRVGGVHKDHADGVSARMAQAVERYAETTGVHLPRTSGIAVRMPVVGDVMMLVADQHIDIMDVGALTSAADNARADAWHYVRAFREFLPGWEDAYLLTTGPQIGIRETRRLAGRDVVAADDVVSGRKRPEDAIARCGWPMEEHVARGRTDYTRIAGGGWYHLPYGSVTSRSTDNLWAGGRLTSCDQSSFASLRVMGTSFGTGHAAGVAAAVTADRGTEDVAAVRAELAGQGALT